MARICIICEGSYPYVVGGVSSWVHDLIKANPEHEFKILCVLPNEEFAVMRYELPENVTYIKNIIINPVSPISPLQVMKNNYLYRGEATSKFRELMDFKNQDLKKSLELFEEIKRENLGTPGEIVVSKVFWRALEGYYDENLKNKNFNIFYWTFRNIFLNLMNLVEEEIPEADIYHPLATGYSGFIASIAKSRGMGRMVITEHGIYPREREEEILNAEWIQKDFKEIWVDFFYYLSKVTYEYADEIVSLFEYNRGLQMEMGAPEERCRVVANGVSLERYRGIKRIEREGFHVGAVLRVVPIKDVKMMLKAFKVAHSKMRGSRFYLIGPVDENPEYYMECREIVRNLEMEDMVEFTGKVDVDRYYEFLDLLVLSSISEGQPLSILEGLACGIPFVATDVGNCREILKEKRDIGEAGIIVPPTSYTDLAEGMIKLYQNQDRMKILGENGKKIVEKYYPREKFIREYKELYERLGG